MAIAKRNINSGAEIYRRLNCSGLGPSAFAFLGIEKIVDRPPQPDRNGQRRRRRRPTHKTTR
eukprot:554078-Prymnesium_polylepis.1